MLENKNTTEKTKLRSDRRNITFQNAHHPRESHGMEKGIRKDKKTSMNKTYC